MNSAYEASRRSAILLRFIRDSKDSRKDDVVFIRPVWTPMSPGVTVLEFSVNSRFAKEYTTGSISANKQMLNYENVKKYVFALLNLVSNDSDPFVNVQIDIPNVPSVLLEPKNIPASIHMLMNLVDLTLYAWPVEAPAPAASPALATAAAALATAAAPIPLWNSVIPPAPVQRTFRNDRVESHY